MSLVGRQKRYCCVSVDTRTEAKILNSGKTSIILGVLNLLNYTGTISIDDREIRTIPPELLRSRITTITQDGVHLRGTVKFNLFPYDTNILPPNMVMNDGIQMDALRSVGLWDIVSRRGDLEAPMKSMHFTRGQLQLFQIARAILHHRVVRSTILLLDEATASLDEETEQEMMALIEEVFHDCIRVNISHRITYVASSHCAIALQEGEAIVARHTPNQDNWTVEIEGVTTG